MNTRAAATPRVVARSVVLVGMLLVLGSLGWSLATTLSVALGSVFAVLHLWSVVHWVKRAFAADTVSLMWVLFSLLKLALLFLGLAWLVRSNIVPVLPFVLGYASLPLGILAAHLFGPLGSVALPNQTGKDEG